MNLKNWLKEPLLHFLVLGAVIFAAYFHLNPEGPGDGEIVVSRGQQEHLVTAFTRTWNRPPTNQEFTGIVRDWIREEIAYREGLEMGLDGNDTIIRRRLRQKLEMLAEDIVTLAPPTAEELEAFRAANEADYTVESIFTLRQVYFSLDKRGDSALRDAEQTLVMLDTDAGLIDFTQMGDPISLPSRLVSERAGAIDGLFGQQFTTALEKVEPGKWSGPVRSGFGVHLVLVEDFQPGRLLTLEEAQQDVQRDWENARRVETIDRLYERLAENYTVTIESFDESGDRDL